MPEVPCTRKTVFRITKVCPPGLYVYNWLDKLSHMENSLRIATSFISPNIAKLVTERQCQTSYGNVEV
ncbi:unnamed protein product [Clavelina lepadiformis]|uniref:Uncharacterized protein n=1 Tax=Clavelina lepadiformis TaxID=159417 RepID=A0ABP0GEU0_CLALP